MTKNDKKWQKMIKNDKKLQKITKNYKKSKKIFILTKNIYKNIFYEIAYIFLYFNKLYILLKYRNI